LRNNRTSEDDRVARLLPGPTVARLSLYLHCLRSLERECVETISSAAMADRCGINAAQFRKDLSYLGEFGRRGVGYDVTHLKKSILDQMGLGRPHKVLLVGAGSLGAALCSYSGFAEQGFRIVAVFDNNALKIGQRIDDIEVLPVSEVAGINRQIGARIAVIAVPAEAAAVVAGTLVAARIKCILNFAPVKIYCGEGITVRNVDLTQELEALAYYLAFSERSGENRA